MFNLTATQIATARSIERAAYIQETTEAGHSVSFAAELWDFTRIDVAPVVYPNGDEGIVFRYTPDKHEPAPVVYAYRKFSTDYSLQFIELNEECVYCTHGEYLPLPGHGPKES